MSVLWAALLCSLLTLSQGRGIMSSVPQTDVDDITESGAKRGIQKRSGGLLGGNLLGGLSGKDGALGGLLGKDGALGGLLGKDGALGGLLGKDGALGGLLGGDGALGGLLGGDGALGGLLGGDGALGGLLGGDGALGGLLGGDGALGGLLGGDGALGGLLGGDGALGGLLGEDGAVAGLLGKDGVLDGLLGKDGLVDGLLDTVIDILIGENGLLGKNGLVGNLLGGNRGNGGNGGNGNLTEVKIVNNTLPKVSLRSLPGIGHEVGFNTQMLLETTSAAGKALCEQVEADVVMKVQDKWAAPQNNKDCETSDISIRVRPNMPLLDQPLQQLLRDNLRELGCNIVNARVNAVSSLLGSRTPALPLGALGDLPPFTINSGDAVQVDLNLLDTRGGAVASPQGLPATLLLATGRLPRLRLSQRALGILLDPAQRQGALNLSITNSMVPNSVSLSTSALLPLIPQLARIVPGSLPLELRVQVAGEPVVAVRDGRATATLKASIDFISPSLQSSLPLFSLHMDVVLNIIPSVSNGELGVSLALDRINLTRVPSRIDPLSVPRLTGWLQQVLAAAYVPAINEALQVSLPLPNVLNTSLRNAEVDITDADNSLDQTALKRFCSGASQTPLPA